MMPAIAVEHLQCRYPNGTLALRDLSLDVGVGEVFGLLGVNGAGKTTMIKVLSTLMRPSAGRVRVLGRDVTKDRVAIKRRIGVMPQDINLDTYLDVRQNLIFHCRFHGIAKRESALRVERWLEALGLRDKALEPVLRLSGGTKRKVMLAKAFLTEPEFLILDEPTAGLDPEMRTFVWDSVLDFRRTRRTVFLSTHYMEEAERLCDRIGILHDGTLAALGRPCELTHKVGEDGRPLHIGMHDVFRNVVGSAA